MIEFIKKWVAKEKVLIAHCVKTLIASSGPMPSEPAPAAGVSSIEKNQIYLTKDIAAKKNLEKYAQRGGAKRQNHRAHGAIIDNLNISKESQQFPVDAKYAAKMAIEMGGMTQDNFYKVPSGVDSSPWKPGEHSMSNPNNLMHGADRAQ